MNTRSLREDRERVCGRCGVRHAPNYRTPGRDYCNDCRPEALQLGWFEQPARRSSQKVNA